MKERLDILLVSKKLAPSREKAKSIIMAGNVFVDGQREDKAGSMFKIGADILVKGNQMKYVSRGGFKLEKAIEVFNLNLSGKTCIDIGSSTGGFTDCMLQNGAKKVYAIDVGTNQLAWSLRQDQRVVTMEKTNIRYVTKTDITDKIDFISIDVSFISLTKVLGVAYNLLDKLGTLVCLIKPQFEAGRDQVGKKGVVKDKKIHEEVIEKLIESAKANEFYPQGLDYSPIKGPEGNIEYLLYLAKNISDEKYIEENIKEIVEKAHSSL